jgi:adenine C2-methylase RlmN of 23S rRNA A2503 and tRNA A37
LFVAVEQASCLFLFPIKRAGKPVSFSNQKGFPACSTYRKITRELLAKYCTGQMLMLKDINKLNKMTKFLASLCNRIQPYVMLLTSGL